MDSTTDSPRQTGIGIDFGTSNSAAAIFDGTRVIMVPLEENQPIMPSATYIDRNFQITTGQSVRVGAMLVPGSAGMTLSGRF